MFGKMDYLGFLISYIIAFISFSLLSYFQIYSKLKELEKSLKGKGVHKRIKKFFLEDNIKEVSLINKSLILTFIFWLVSSGLYFAFPQFKGIFLVFIFFSLFFNILLFITLVINHHRTYRDSMNAIKNSSTIEEFLTLFGVEKGKSKILNKMIIACKDEKDILSWLLYYIGFKEPNLIKKKFMKQNGKK